MRPDPHAASAQAGFTLLEMLVVLAILGLAMGLILGRGPLRSPALAAQAAARELSQALRQARSQAIVTNRHVVLSLDLANGRYQVDAAAPHQLPAGLALAMIAVDGEAGPRQGGIGFFADGSSTGGRIAVAGGRVALQIGVDWLTGRVTLANAR